MSSVRLRPYQRAYLKAHGSGPWPCAYCGEPIHELGRDHPQGVVHHVDEDRTNNGLDNLQVMHASCHKRHHNKGKPAAHGYTPEVLRKMMENRGVRRPERKFRCECGLETHAGPMKRHTNKTNHQVEEKQDD